MASTPSFNWATPDNTGLVKNGALDIRTLGNAIDASMTDLLGGTTGQVLAKASNTDMDFVWAADAGAPESLGFTAGKNKIINGDFGINQRAFTSTTTSGTFGFDRFNLTTGGDGTTTYSAQTFTAGTAPVAGYESTNFAQLVTTGQTNTSVLSSLSQKIESVRTFAAQTITVSFWAKASSGTPNITAFAFQNFGTGGSTGVFTGSTKKAISTSWARYSFTIAVPSISGKTIGTGDHLRLDVCVSAGSTRDAYTDTLGIQTGTFQIWGVQAEAGSVSTAFQTATGTIQGETSACMRYYYRVESAGGYRSLISGYAGNANSLTMGLPLPSEMRIIPTSLDTSAMASYYYESGAGGTTPTTVTLSTASTENFGVISVAKTGAFTAGNNYFLFSNNTAAYLGFSAEL